jgi:hypothetical protein
MTIVISLSAGITNGAIMSAGILPGINVRRLQAGSEVFEN